MRYRPTVLINTPDIELWPTHLARARSNQDARALARAEWLLRRKRDGKFIAVASDKQTTALIPHLEQSLGLADALGALAMHHQRAASICRTHLPNALTHSEHLAALGIDEDYSDGRDLPIVAEPCQLALAGFDRYRRPLWLFSPAAAAWQRMHRAAAAEAIVLEAISGYRSVWYQRAIFDRKLARGQTVAEILSVNAAPGYSEHHSGCAIDISSRGEAAAEESFELTTAFDWLNRNAAAFGFSMSYPRDNRHGVVYEPWHWRWRAGDKRLY